VNRLLGAWPKAQARRGFLRGLPRPSALRRRPGASRFTLLIDGGAGQVGAVAGVLDELGVSGVPIVGVAKGEDRNAGREEFHLPGRPPLALRHNDPVLYFIQRLRDEAHRFAIGTHRARRSKTISATPLDEVPGVGVCAVEGISEKLARQIYDFFHERG